MRTIRENAGRLILFSAMVIGFTACSNVKIESLAEQKKEVSRDTQAASNEQEPFARNAVMTYAQGPSQMGSVERVGEQESNSGGVITTDSENSVQAETTTETKKKKGISNTAKGAMIGAGAGAITGAVVSKKRGKGALIGGAIGAAVGAGVGAVIDKKQRDSAEK